MFRIRIKGQTVSLEQVKELAQGASSDMIIQLVMGFEPTTNLLNLQWNLSYRPLCKKQYYLIWPLVETKLNKAWAPVQSSTLTSEEAMQAGQWISPNVCLEVLTVFGAKTTVPHVDIFTRLWHGDSQIRSMNLIMDTACP